MRFSAIGTAGFEQRPLACEARTPPTVMRVFSIACGMTQRHRRLARCDPSELIGFDPGASGQRLGSVAPASNGCPSCDRLHVEWITSEARSTIPNLCGGSRRKTFSGLHTRRPGALEELPPGATMAELEVAGTDDGHVR
jgi:hypothetical protein